VARRVGATGLGPPGRAVLVSTSDYSRRVYIHTLSFPPPSQRRRYKVLYTPRVHHPFPPTTTAARHPASPKTYHPQ